MDRLTKARILDALHALADELGGRATQVRVGVVGGAALVVLYGARESTKDVDAFVISGAEAHEVREAANRVASRLRLPEDWLNDAAKGYVIRVAPGPTMFETHRCSCRRSRPSSFSA